MELAGKTAVVTGASRGIGEAIARALAAQPTLILADEPTGSLDEQAGDKVADLLLAEARKQGTAVLLATHDMELAARADRIVRLKEGKISEA